MPEIPLAARILPDQADPDGWTNGVQREIEVFPRRWCDADPWLAEHPPRHEAAIPSIDSARARTRLGWAPPWDLAAAIALTGERQTWP